MRKILWILKYRVFLFLVILVIICSIFIKGYFSISTKEYIKYNCTNKINEIIVTTLNEEVVANIPNDSLMKVTYNNDNEVVYAYIDTKKTTEILSNTSNYIVNLTKEFNNTRSYIDIPLGYLVSSNVFLGSNIKVPISVSNIAKYSCTIDTKVEEYGINSSMVTVSLVYNFSFKAIVPLVTDDVVVSNSIPLLTTVMYGDVPNYFFTGEKPNISIS